MTDRGASEEEVISTIHKGTEWSARPPAIGKELVFRAGYHYDERWYPHKQIRVIYVTENEVTSVLTVIVRYGEWE